MRYLVNGEETEVALDPGSSVRVVGDRLFLTVGGQTHSGLAVRRGDTVLVSLAGRTFEIQKATARQAAKHQAGGDAVAPMPGQIVEVFVEQGQRVEAGQRLLVLEAMKMQHVMSAPFAGEVVQIPVSKGDQVTEGQLLAQVEERDESGL
ncbi:MAG: biotin/lipoyl-binding protein [Armatimonadetes bacterium]|nr:biotin/lipoyl-binding protein [Armatimonadota bacterium]